MPTTQEIWKYPLQLDSAGNYPAEMPVGATIRSVQIQDGQICLWAQGLPGSDIVNRQFAIYGTGQPLPDSPGSYLGTVQDGAMVWHVFEVTQ